MAARRREAQQEPKQNAALDISRNSAAITEIVVEGMGEFVEKFTGNKMVSGYMTRVIGGLKSFLGERGTGLTVRGFTVLMRAGTKVVGARFAAPEALIAGLNEAWGETGDTLRRIASENSDRVSAGQFHEAIHKGFEKAEAYFKSVMSYAMAWNMLDATEQIQLSPRITAFRNASVDKEKLWNEVEPALNRPGYLSAMISLPDADWEAHLKDFAKRNKAQEGESMGSKISKFLAWLRGPKIREIKSTVQGFTRDAHTAERGAIKQREYLEKLRDGASGASWSTIVCLTLVPITLTVFYLILR